MCSNRNMHRWTNMAPCKILTLTGFHPSRSQRRKSSEVICLPGSRTATARRHRAFHSAWESNSPARRYQDLHRDSLKVTSPRTHGYLCLLLSFFRIANLTLLSLEADRGQQLERRTLQRNLKSLKGWQLSADRVPSASSASKALLEAELIPNDRSICAKWPLMSAQSPEWILEKYISANHR